MSQESSSGAFRRVLARDGFFYAHAQPQPPQVPSFSARYGGFSYAEQSSKVRQCTPNTDLIGVTRGVTSLPLFGEDPGRTDRPIALTPEVDALIAAGAPVAVGISGGKDSTVAAFETLAHLDRVGHTGPRVLIHSHLGQVEWGDSRDICRRLADRLGVELMIVQRERGGLMERWEQRWRDNVERYVSLSCVRLIMPWSAPGLRFCTSELKTDVICRALVRRFPGQRIVSVSGIRADESTDRANAPICEEQPKLHRTTLKTSGVNWNPIKHFTLADVLALHDHYGFPLAPAYTVYGSSRYSCVYCIYSTQADIEASARCDANHAVGRRMVDLEIASTFAFQGARWLGDVLTPLLSPDQRSGLARAKIDAALRQTAEARIPEHLLYTKGWPTCVPTRDEAELLAGVRRDVGKAVGLPVRFTDADSVVGRYQELMALKRAKARKAVHQ